MIAAVLLAPFALATLFSPPVEQKAVLRATLQWFEREAPLCVDPDLARAPFESARGDLLDYADGDRARLPNKAQRHELYQSIFAGWKAPDGKVLADDTAHSLVDAAIALAETGPELPLPPEPVGELDGSGPPPPPPRTFGTLSADLLGKGEVLRTDHSRGCRSLTLSAVAMHDVIAFVDVGLVAGPLNGAGATYALRRENGSWRMIAFRRTWIS